ncbi:MAG: hypothetical protein EXR72_00600 [Myxococcales bacterium]|nr:hypothetical protein [Myxococcales bacterium]
MSRPLLWSALALLLLAAPARASTILPLDLRELCAHADQILVARVESQTARWNSDHSAIYTDVSLRVSRSMKGEAVEGELVIVRREGGEAEGMGMLVTGAARFSDGEEVVVFLERRGAARWTVGMAQGKLRVATVAGKRVALRSVAGLEFTARQAGGPPLPPSRPLDELLADIARAVREQPAKGSR